MIGAGSLQLRRFVSARKQGRTMMTAAVEAGISIAEARLHEAALAAGEYDEIPDLNDPQPTAPAAVAPPIQPERVNVGQDPGDVETTMDGPGAPSTAQEKTMARGRKPKADKVEQIFEPDFDLAVTLYREDIKPAQSSVGEFAQEMSQAYKDIKKRAHIQPQAARAAFRLDNMEESKRDDWLRSFNGLLKALGIFMPADLVDQAEGNARKIGRSSRSSERSASWRV